MCLIPNSLYPNVTKRDASGGWSLHSKRRPRSGCPCHPHSDWRFGARCGQVCHGSRLWHHKCADPFWRLRGRSTMLLNMVNMVKLDQINSNYIHESICWLSPLLVAKNTWTMQLFYFLAQRDASRESLPPKSLAHALHLARKSIVKHDFTVIQLIYAYRSYRIADYRCWFCDFHLQSQLVLHKMIHKSSTPPPKEKVELVHRCRTHLGGRASHTVYWLMQGHKSPKMASTGTDCKKNHCFLLVFLSFEFNPPERAFWT